MLFDERRKGMPSRHAGLAPNCMQCDGDGNFVDFARGTGDTVPLDGRDRRFDAVHTLRYIGYVLHSIGYTCDELYDPDNQYRDIYGPYQQELCEAQ
ncbi:hypothetical protein CYMTET_25126 [Cymbomonas tetramitiformis]|uniref:Uncharacterized protein n=2 Tax=Cymbomonas tetramitiformis TaxID=36881 RepID=A0AAE0KZD2_9CHLO|nr:hypothetical protein CYMTET_25126 [Cymbomonas tetramitiformis]